MYCHKILRACLVKQDGEQCRCSVVLVAWISHCQGSILSHQTFINIRGSSRKNTICGRFTDTVLWVESDEFCQSVITQRQKEGNLANAPILDDARVIAQFCKDNSVIADRVTGGFPCQGTSCAGLRQGMKDPRTGLVSFLFECFDSVNAQGPW